MDASKINQEILNPNQLVLYNEADCTSTDFYNGEQGCLAFDVNATKLGFITSAGVSEETITSG
jgi:hypothetical protein